MTAVRKKLTFSNTSKGWAFAAALFCVFAPQSLTASAFADDEVLLKPDVPKLDTPVETPKKTLKGTIQHSHKQPDPGRKPLSTGTNQTGSGFGFPGLGHMGARRTPIKAQVKNNAL